MVRCTFRGATLATVLRDSAGAPSIPHTAAWIADRLHASCDSGAANGSAREGPAAKGPLRPLPSLRSAVRRRHVVSQGGFTNGNSALCPQAAALDPCQLPPPPAAASPAAHSLLMAAAAALASGKMLLAVCGLHLRGQPLNHQLTSLSSTFVREVQSAPEYRWSRRLRRLQHGVAACHPANVQRDTSPSAVTPCLLAQGPSAPVFQPATAQRCLPGPPAPCRLYAFTDATGKTKPGMVAVADGSGTAVHLEVWEMPIQNFGHFMLQASRTWLLRQLPRPVSVPGREATWVPTFG